MQEQTENIVILAEKGQEVKTYPIEGEDYQYLIPIIQEDDNGAKFLVTGKLEDWDPENNKKTHLQIHKIPVTEMSESEEDFKKLVGDIKTLWLLINAHTKKSVRKNTLERYWEFLFEHRAEIENYTNWEDIVKKLQEFVEDG